MLKKSLSLLLLLALLCCAVTARAGGGFVTGYLEIGDSTYEVEVESFTASRGRVTVTVQGLDPSAGAGTWAAIRAGGKWIPAASASAVKNGAMDFVFNAGSDPEAIYVYPTGDPDSAVLLWRDPEAPPEDADESYYEALAFMKEERWFSAYEAFRKSGAEDAQDRAEACVQPWPASGEISRSVASGGKTELTIKVNQRDDHALFVRLIKDGKPASCLFIGGSGSVTVKLPAGKYTIEDGSGRQWFGMKEAFGRGGSYETMTFDDAGTTTVTFKSGGRYTLTINVTEADPDATGVGSEYEDWETFAR